MTLEALGGWLQRLALRTGEGPLRPLWALLHWTVIRLVARRVTRGVPGCATYLKGGFGFGRPTYGLSDVDAIVVAPDRPRRERLDAAWTALGERYPTLAALFQLWPYEADAVRDLARSDHLTFGLRPDGEDAGAYFGPGRIHDPMAVLERPGLFGARQDWRALGARRRAPDPDRAAPARHRWAWLELRYLWGLAFRLVTLPPQASSAQTAYKLFADAARVWLWLDRGIPTFAREDALRHALALMPDEQSSLRRALTLERSLPHRPSPPTDEALAFLTRTSARVAARWAADAAATSASEVQLQWDPERRLELDRGTHARAGRLAEPSRPRLVPLVDWRARSFPGLIDLSLLAAPGDPADPVAVAELARGGGEDLFPALRHDDVLVFPTTEVWARGKLRGAECPLSDPVSFALLEGRRTADFPDLPGFSVQDCARRAVAEHRAWLLAGSDARAERLPYWMSPPYHPELVELCGSLTAVRAALFADSVRDGAPELILTAEDVTARWAELGPAASEAAAAARDELRRCRADREVPDPRVVGEVRRCVASLPAYRAPRSDGSVG